MSHPVMTRAVAGDRISKLITSRRRKCEMRNAKIKISRGYERGEIEMNQNIWHLAFRISYLSLISTYEKTGRASGFGFRTQHRLITALRIRSPGTQKAAGLRHRAPVGGEFESLA